MPNVHGVKHKVKFSNGTFEIPMPEEERDRQDETITRVGFTDYCWKVVQVHRYQEKI